MGADLIGYFCVGPKRLDDTPEKRAAAVARILAFSRAAAAWNDADSDESDDATRAAAGPLLAAFDDPGDVAWACDVSEKDAHNLIDDLFAVWGGAGRDVACRSLPPGNVDDRAVFAGAASWGDEPDGYGYTTLKRADQSGLLAVYGIR